MLALVMAGDYVTDYVDPLAFGPLLLSVAGIVLTLFAFVGPAALLVVSNPDSPRQKGRVSLLRLPGSGGRALHRLRPGSGGRVHDLP